LDRPDLERKHRRAHRQAAAAWIEDAWGAQSPSTRIVAIGAAGGFDAKALEDAFASCIAA